MPMNALKRSATVTSFDPLTLLPALAVVTEHLGLIATASTTYNEPYHVARKFASLDQLCLSPQCGFASTEEGNILAEDEQWAKLRMIVELADKVWGKS